MSQVIAIGTNAAKVEGHEIYPIKQAIINAWYALYVFIV